MVCGTVSGMVDAEKVRENRLRQAVARQGCQLMKSRRRDPRALDFGRYAITNQVTGAVVAGGDGFNGYGLTLDDVDQWVNRKEVSGQAGS
jgi:hypothetical protein